MPGRTIVHYRGEIKKDKGLYLRTYTNLGSVGRKDAVRVGEPQDRARFLPKKITFVIPEK